MEAAGSFGLDSLLREGRLKLVIRRVRDAPIAWQN